MTPFDWFYARMTPRRARAVLRWAQMRANIIWMWRNLTTDEDGAPNDPYAAAAAARRYLEVDP